MRRGDVSSCGGSERQVFRGRTAAHLPWGLMVRTCTLPRNFSPEIRPPSRPDKTV